MWVGRKKGLSMFIVCTAFLRLNVALKEQREFHGLVFSKG